MNNKSFVLILTVILAWGISLGGVFSFGLSIGESRGEAAAKDLLERETIPPPTRQDDVASQVGRGEIEGVLGGQLGDLTPEQMQRLRQQLQRRLGGDGVAPERGQGAQATDRAGLQGTIENFDGDEITINTPQGPLTVMINKETTLVLFNQGNVDDLKIGERVLVASRRSDDGTVNAISVVAIPEELAELIPGARIGGGSR
tara:strand:- start:382 stop:984 length:603 start_codon:yes stop_codon:yes gene_type:complete